MTDAAIVSNLNLLDGLNETLPNNASWYSTLPISPAPRYHIVAQPNEGLNNSLQLERIVKQQWIDYGNAVQASEFGLFLWEIPIKPYALGIFEGEIRNATSYNNQNIPPTFPESVRKGGPSGCRYISKDASQHIKVVTNRIWREVQDPTATMGFLHI